MHIAIDCREAVRPHKAGKGMWSYYFLSELLQRDIPITAISDSPHPEQWDTYFSPHSQASYTTIASAGLRWHRDVIRLLKTDTSIDLYVSPTSYIVPSLLPKHISSSIVIHDLIAFEKGTHEKKARIIEHLTLHRALKRSAFIWTNSEHTKQELLSRYMTVTPHSVTPLFGGPTIYPHQCQTTEEPYIFSIGTLCPRKNQLRLIKAYTALPDSLRNTFRLILAGGRGWDDEEIIQEAEHTPGVDWVGYIDQETYQQYISHCTVLAYPSLTEGFGFPVLDALSLQKAVLTADRGGVCEIGGGHAVTINPEEEDSIRDGLVRLLSDANLRKRLGEEGYKHAQKYSWVKTVDRFFDRLSSLEHTIA